MAVSRVERALQHPAATRVVVALGVLVALPTAFMGFFADDYALMAELKHAWTEALPWWDMHRFTAATDEGNRALTSAGLLPWWAAPSLRVHLLRPLSSALFALDFKLFGQNPLGAHLHSLLWWLALLIIVRALYRRLLPGAAGTLALLVFALAPAHIQTYAWISARHMLVAAVPAAGALLAHVRARQEGWTAGRWLGPAASPRVPGTSTR